MTKTPSSASCLSNSEACDALTATAQAVLVRLASQHGWTPRSTPAFMAIRDYDTFRGPAPANLRFVLDKVNGLIYSKGEFTSAGENVLALARGGIFRAGQSGAELNALVDEFAANVDKAVATAFSVRMMCA